MHSNAFTGRVYAACALIPKGKVATYADVARMIGSPKAARAVGNALNKNPFPSSRVPCHRVVRSDGDVGGFARGKKEKMKLLRKEGVKVRADGRIGLECSRAADLDLRKG